ncbi:hypothetical protein V1264_015705 [Littorina saxatilis]|uniref:Uncharacterized protein n=1 Tax=Littorina saxatilis TaxID=31220 RepID=A0AAN9BMB0_9CAEN
MSDARSDGYHKSHVAEDIKELPAEIYSPEVLLDPNSGPQTVLPHLYRARDASREQGNRPVELREKRDLELLSIQERMDTFNNVTNAWAGPPSTKMALAGFYRVFGTTTRCAYCTLHIRNWTLTDDPWARHKSFSPFCKRLLQVGDAGIHPSPQGKRRLRHSCSSLADLKCHRGA